jgi:urease accessory protein
MTTRWLIWQIADSAFPTGAFAHSFGLEAAWQQGEVTAASLSSFVHEAILQAGHGSVPFVVSAYDDPLDVAAIDERCDAFLRNAVANRASRMQGRAWLSTVERSFPDRAVLDLCGSIRSARGPRHFAPAFGSTMKALGIERREAVRLFLFGVARGTLSAAVRLGIVGTMDAQRLLSECGSVLDLALERSEKLSMDDAAQTAPLIDLWQASHDRLYSRLFQS